MRRSALAIHKDGADGQLRDRSRGIEIGKQPIHAAIGQADFLYERAIRLQGRMDMGEKLEILADNEEMNELLVNNLEAFRAFPCDRIEGAKRQDGVAARLQKFG